MTLFPKFPFYLANPYYEENIRTSLDPKELQSIIDIESTEGLEKLPIGDTIGNIEIQSIRDKCVAELKGYGLSIEQPPNDLVRNALDYYFAVSLYKNLQNYLEPAMASDTGMWMYFNLRVFPDFVVYRWRKKETQGYTINPEHFFKLTRNYCGTLWWRAHFFRDESKPNDQWWLLRQLSEDNLVSITERTNLRGYTNLPLVLGKKILDINALKTSYKLKETLFRRMMVILLARISCINLHLLQEIQGEVERLVNEVYELAYKEVVIEKHEIAISPVLSQHKTINPEAVIEWLGSQLNTSGTLYLESVAREYMDALHSSPAKFEVSLPLDDRNVFSCQTPDTLLSYWEIFKAAPNYNQVNSSTAGMFSAGMECLLRYLQHLSNTKPNVELADKLDIIRLLENQKLEYVDKRNSNGALWVIGGKEITTKMMMLRSSGFSFQFKEGGGKSSDYKDAWWYK